MGFRDIRNRLEIFSFKDDVVKNIFTANIRKFYKESKEIILQSNSIYECQNIK